MCHSSTSSSDRAAAWALVRRFLVFGAPILAALAVAEWAMYRVGESWPLAKSTAARDEHDELVVSRTIFSQQFNVFKTAILREDAPGVVVLGSSRVMKFRDFMFAPYDTSFYNAGSLFQDLVDLTAYADHVQRGALPAPELAIVGVDNWWLPAWKRDERSWLSDLDVKDAVFLPVARVVAMRELVWNVRAGNITARALASGVPAPARYTGVPAIGMLALANGSGFRRDGSRADPIQFRAFLHDSAARDAAFQPEMNVARRRVGHLADTELDGVMLDALYDALAKLRDCGSEVVVFLPPFADRVVDELARTGPMPRWWDAFYTVLPGELRARGFTVVSLQQPAEWGFTDDYMLDGVHPSAVLVAHVVLDMVRRAPEGSMLATVDTTRICEKLHEDDTIPAGFDVPRQWLNGGR